MQSETILADQILMAIRRVFGPGHVMLHEPSFEGNELPYLKDCIDTTFVSSVGKYVDRFELELAAITGAKYAIATVNGTAALHIALKIAGVQPGEEVLIPALTFVATANAVSYCGATPHFVDSDESNLGVDSFKLRDYLIEHTEQKAGQCVNSVTGKIIRAIVPMHAFGHPVDMDGLMSVAHDFNIVVVEDAAESLGSYYKGRHTGTIGLLGTLSFNGNKTITTGGGGAILTNDKALAEYAKHLTTTAKLAHSWEYRHDEVGYNYRLPNLNAALGCTQLEQLPLKLARKRELFEVYQKAFCDIEGIKLLAEPKGCESNYWLQTLLLDPDKIECRDSILKITNQEGLMTRPAWVLMHELAAFKGCPRMDLTIATSLYKRIINIPSSQKLWKK